MKCREKAPVQTRASFAFLIFLLCLLCLSNEPALAAAPPIPSGDVRIHYFRPDGNYSGWAIYTWNAHPTPGWCSGEVPITATDRHPVQRSSSDTLTRQSAFDSKAGAATVPALTTAVFVSGEE